MCKFYSVVYFSLLVVFIVECHDVNKELPNEDVKLSKPHHQSRLTTKDDAASKTSSNDDVESNEGSTEEPSSRKTNQEEENKSNSTSNLAEEPNNTAEENISRTGDDVQRTIFVGSLTKESNTRENSDSYDYSDSNDFDMENSNDESVEQIIPSSEFVEILIYTPNKKSLSQDAVLDLRARTGNIQLEDKSSNDNSDQSEENIPNIDISSSHNTNLRSGYPPDYVDDISDPFDYKQVDVNPYNQPNFAYSNDLMSQYNRPMTTRPETIHNNVPNYLSKIPPRFFNGINSRESLYPPSNSREMWEQGNFGQRNTMKSPYFGQIYPNTQILNQSIRDRCPACFPGRISSQDRTFRSAGADPNTFQTANGRSIDFAPLNDNSYPLAPAQDPVVVQRVQNAPPRELLRSPHNVPLSRESGISRENTPSSNRNVQSSEFQTDLGKLSKVFLTFPALAPRPNPILLNRRIRLGGIHRFV